jgi:poly-gamma-glutamate synthase PgsB/CapB
MRHERGGDRECPLTAPDSASIPEVTLAIPLALLLVVLAGLGAIEHARLVRQRASIPDPDPRERHARQVVRRALIAAALRAHGVRTYAKTTGSLPRWIAPTAASSRCFRPGCTNVIEQRRMIAIAAADRAEALVLECMALHPRLQSLLRAANRALDARRDQQRLARPSRRDGPGRARRRARAARHVPRARRAVHGRREQLPLFEAACRDRGTRLVCVGERDTAAISDEELARFGYLEHRENVALALAVCAELGIARDVALAGMLAAEPDVGALRECEIDFFGRRVVFVNGFAANDPVATERVWNLALARHRDLAARLMVVNCRADRPDRSRQLGLALPLWAPADRYVLVGSGTFALARSAVRAGLPAARLTPLEGETPASVFRGDRGCGGPQRARAGRRQHRGIGLELASYFEHRSRLNADEHAA